MATLKVTNIKNESFAGDQLYLKTDGKIGIGTTSPGHKLVISQGNSGGIAAIHLPVDESTILGPNANTHLKMGGNVVLGANGQIDLSTSGASKVTIKNDGKVGIGTTSPVGLLELDGASSAFTLQLKETSGAYHRMGFKKNNNLFQLGEFSNDGTTFTPVLNLDANGDKIGIGESSPDHIFHIKGSTPILGVESSSWVSGVSAALRLSYTDGNAREIRGHYDHGLQFTTNQGEAFRIKTDGNVSVLLGNIEIGTAGKGIDFSAQTASSVTGITVNGELLDHFEEGTWTPVQPTVGWYSGAEIEGKYQRVGHWVTATFIVKFPTNGSGVQGLIDGLPFASGATGSAARHGGAPTYTTDSNVQSFLIGNGEARIYIYNGSGAAVQCSHLDDDEIRGTVIYRVA